MYGQLDNHRYCQQRRRCRRVQRRLLLENARMAPLQPMEAFWPGMAQWSHMGMEVICWSANAACLQAAREWDAGSWLPLGCR